MRTLLVVSLGWSLVGCGKLLFGSGTVFVWNGTDRRQEVVVDGRSSDSFTIPSHSGERIDAVAGKYRVVQGQRVYEFDLKGDTTVVVNLGSEACFARADISGMYQPGKERVRLVQTYDRGDVLTFDPEVPVLPGEPPPATRPRSSYGLQRLSDVPCNLLRDEAAMSDWVRRSH